MHWLHGAAAGLVAAAVMGLTIVLMDAPVLRDAIAGLYLLGGNVVAGIFAHLVHGALFGLLFAMVLADPIMHEVNEVPWKTVLAGVVYGLVLAVVGTGIIMPMWLEAVGAVTGFPVPYVTAPLVFWHLVYGVVLGSVYSFLKQR